MSEMSAKDARNLELAVRELTAELKRQRGVDPDASIADKPQRLTEQEPTVGPSGGSGASDASGGIRIPSENIKGFRTVGDTVFVDIEFPEEGAIAKALRDEMPKHTTVYASGGYTGTPLAGASWNVSVDSGYVMPQTGYSARSMEILSKSMEELNDKA